MNCSQHRKAFFFDRDGVVNYRIVNDYVKSYKEMVIIPDFIPFFKLVKEKGYLAILVTNQQGIGKNILTYEDFNNVTIFMQVSLKKLTGYLFDDIYFCPDLQSNNSPFRKPEPGMILQAASKWNINLTLSWIVGDNSTDIIAGKKAGVKTVLIGNSSSNNLVQPDYYFENLTKALEKLEL